MSAKRSAKGHPTAQCTRETGSRIPAGALRACGMTDPEHMRLALYEPDIPQNTGTILRLAACLGVPVDVIGPTGFDMTDRALRRAALDYLRPGRDRAAPSFAAFEAARRCAAARASCCSPRAATGSTRDFAFRRRRHPAARAGERRRPRGGARGRRRTAAHSDAAPACARSTWRLPAPWCWARRCARRAGFPRLSPTPNPSPQALGLNLGRASVWRAREGKGEGKPGGVPDQTLGGSSSTRRKAW